MRVVTMPTKNTPSNRGSRASNARAYTSCWSGRAGLIDADMTLSYCADLGRSRRIRTFNLRSRGWIFLGKEWRSLLDLPTRRIDMIDVRKADRARRSARPKRTPQLVRLLRHERPQVDRLSSELSHERGERAFELCAVCGILCKLPRRLPIDIFVRPGHREPDCSQRVVKKKPARPHRLMVGF